MRTVSVPSFVLAATSLVFTACVSVVPYAPRPASVSNPETEIEKILVANSGGQIAIPEFREGFFTVKSVTSTGVLQQTVRYESVVDIRLYSAPGVYQVIVKDKAGHDAFVWGVRTLDDAQKLADSIAAISAPALGQAGAGTSM